MVSQDELAEEIFFLGAGASVAAGVPDTFGMVDAFEQSLEPYEKRILEDILRILRDWKSTHEGAEGVDVELLLETMERLSNLGQEVLAKFLRLPESKAEYLFSQSVLRQATSRKERYYLRLRGAQNFSSNSLTRAFCYLYLDLF